MKKALVLAIVAGMLLSLQTGAAMAESHSWYFSQSGNDSTGDGSAGNPWKTLSKAKIQIDAADSSDTVNLYFKRGDTWTVDTLRKTIIHGFKISSSNPIVNMDAYGSGDRPCIDGGVTDFSTAPVHDTVNGPLRWSAVFRFEKDNCSVKNVEITNVYGIGVLLNNADYFTLSHCEIHNFGATALGVHFQYGVENSIAEYNTVHTGQQLWRYGLREAGWGGGISFTASGYGEDSQCKNNIIRYNLIYDIFGEGCQAPGGITEYNVIGDTYSTGIYPSPHDFDAYDTIIRYNFVIMSGNSDYQSPYPIPSIHNGRAAHNGIGLIDENLGGSNVNANIEIYGNIVINRYYGIYAKNSMDTENPFKSIKIYNNTVIDSILGNYIIAQPEEFTNGYIYNNSSILYDRIDAIHGGHGATFPHANWTIDNNHFWTTGGSPTVDDGWTTNCVIADPDLPGEPSIDWDGQSGPTYYKDIKFNDIYPSADSPLINAGKTLDAGYNNIFLTEGTDFGALPDEAAFKTASQTGHGNWEIGAFVYTGVTQSPIDQTGWSLVYVDSEEKFGEGEGNGWAIYSFDGDPDTFWSTAWYEIEPDPCCPHEIQIDLGGFYDICGFRYLPRQDTGEGSENGMIKDYEFYVSNNTDDWGIAVASGTWTIGKMEKQVSFDCKLGKYVRLVALSEVEDRPWTSMAELNVLAVQPDSDINNDGKVNIEDFAVIATWWDNENACSSPDWCGGTDFNMSGMVDMLDFAYFAENWLRRTW